MIPINISANERLSHLRLEVSERPMLPHQPINQSINRKAFT